MLWRKNGTQEFVLRGNDALVQEQPSIPLNQLAISRLLQVMVMAKIATAQDKSHGLRGLEHACCSVLLGLGLRASIDVTRSSDPAGFDDDLIP